MTRRDVIKKLEKNGYIFKRHGSDHNVYWSSQIKKTVPVKRHREIDGITANEIFKQAGI